MGRKWILRGTAVSLLLVLWVAACTAPAAEEANSGELENIASGTSVPPTQEEIVVDLPDLGEAPEFKNDVWLNSDGPVTLADQRGKVVLLEFWTFG